MQKRKNDRNLCAELVKTVFMDKAGRKRILMAALEDISASGACLQLEDPIPVGTAISILYPSGRYHGRVKYCKFQQTGYFLGIEFDPGYRWSKEDFEPAHLLELGLDSDRLKK